MVLNLITFASLLHKQASILGSHELILNELEKYFTVNIVEYQNINKLTKDDFSLLFIATGGVERLVIQHFESLPRPAILLAASQTIPVKDSSKHLLYRNREAGYTVGL